MHVSITCVQVVPLDLKSDEQELKAFNVRLDDLYAIDLTFLQGFDRPTLAYLAEVRLYAKFNVHVHVQYYTDSVLCKVYSRHTDCMYKI